LYLSDTIHYVEDSILHNTEDGIEEGGGGGVIRK